MFPSPPIAVAIVWRIRLKIIRTVQCCIVYWYQNCTHKHTHTNMSTEQFLQVYCLVRFRSSWGFSAVCFVCFSYLGPVRLFWVFRCIFLCLFWVQDSSSPKWPSVEWDTKLYSLTRSVLYLGGRVRSCCRIVKSMSALHRNTVTLRKCARAINDDLFTTCACRQSTAAVKGASLTHSVRSACMLSVVCS